MMYDFSADDVFEMAERMERNGVAFYRSAAEKAGDAEVERMLLKLAAMEEEHEKIFTKMRARLTEESKEKTVFDPEDEAVLYLRALADTRVFFKKEIDVASMTEVLKSAIVAEKDSIVFYLGMKDAVPDKMGKENIEGIIKEEMGHIKVLSAELVKVKQ
jgi:rubrerythrin